MKRQVCRLVAVVFVLGLFMATTNAHAMEKTVGEALSNIHFGGLIEVGAAWQDVEYEDGSTEDASDLCLTTLELGAEAEVNDWVSVAVLFLYEDATSFEGENDETSVDLDVATVTIGNTEEYPFYVTAGKMYAPFGALLTHFPDDPLIDQPLTLLMGETLEKAVLVGGECPLGFKASAYVFNGDMDEEGKENQIESYGVDVNYSYNDEQGFDLMVGASYISNVAESDGLEEALGEEENLAEILELEDYDAEHDQIGLKDYVAGVAAYLHLGYERFFCDVEYMEALDDFEFTGVVDGEAAAYDSGRAPSVWNVELGYNLDWGKNLEIVLKYAGSDDSKALGFPEKRYGLCLNQEIFDDVVVSLAYLNDDYESDLAGDLDKRDVVFGQIAIEF